MISHRTRSGSGQCSPPECSDDIIAEVIIAKLVGGHSDVWTAFSIVL